MILCPKNENENYYSIKFRILPIVNSDDDRGRASIRFEEKYHDCELQRN